MSEHTLDSVIDEDAFTHLSVPSLEDVRRDAAKAPYVRQCVQPSVEGDFVTPFVEAPSGRRAQDLLPHLYAYSIRARCDDIPDDLVAECIWVLEIQSACWHKDPNRSPQSIRPVAKRLYKLYTRPDVRPPECTAEIMDGVLTSLRCMMGPEDPTSNLEHAIILAKSAVNDDEAERVLTRFLALDDQEAFYRRSRTRAQLHLARVFRRKGRVQEASVMETELVRWFKKNPHVFIDSALKDLWASDNGEVQMDPVLTALGGRSWLDSRKRTVKTEERRMKFCSHCDNDDLRVAFKLCGACKDVWYCSAGCQKANWPFHKELCKFIVESLKMTGQDREFSNELLGELRAWMTLYRNNNGFADIHALGLHRDTTRGRTHTLITEVEHNPSAVAIPKKFAVVSCGVFRIEDIVGTLDQMMGLGEGAGQGLFRKFLLRCEAEHSSDLVPAFQLVTCGNKARSLFCDGINPRTIKRVSYNANWKQTINGRGKQAPRTMLRWHGAKNAEHDVLLPVASGARA